MLVVGAASTQGGGIPRVCGIAGVIDPAGRSLEAPARRMLAALRHRGPDAANVWVAPGCALAHARLSVVDLVTGAQPMVSHDGRHAVVFNGEIYGYKELRQQLEYPFRTSSDTEVLLASLRLHGTAAIRGFAGMFAFAMWDCETRRLVCARDRFGEKPLYYATGAGGEFLFASEVKAIIASGLVSPILDRASVAHFLSRLYVHPAQTIYTNVHTVPPGHMLILEDGAVHIRKYWEPPPTDMNVGLEDAAAELRLRLAKAVKRQLVADVEIGAFLSGGLDSSTIVALAARENPRLRTFCFSFDYGASEAIFAEQVADHYKTTHVVLSETGVDLADVLCEIQDVYDEPFADSSAVPTYLLCRLARHHVKVALTGDGGDEMCGGYAWYQPLAAMEFLQRHRLATFLARSRGLGRVARRALPAALRRHLDIALTMTDKHGSIAGAHRSNTEYLTHDVLAGLELPQPAEGPWRHNAPAGTLDDALWMDIDDYLPGDILVKTDRASMAHGLELRSPFLDPLVADFCLSLPASKKVALGRDKLVLRAAFSADWPPVVAGRAKQGFGAPVTEWLGLRRMRELVAQLTRRSNRLYDILPFEPTQQVLAGNGYRVWMLLVLSLWAERHRFSV